MEKKNEKLCLDEMALDKNILKMSETMYVKKRNGDLEERSFDKCLKRIQQLSKDLKVNTIEVAQLIITQIYNGVETSKLDELAAEICAAKITMHPDYSKLSSRIIISNHHKKTSPSYSEVIQLLHDYKNEFGINIPLINDKLYKMVMENKEKINATIDYNKDFNYDYFGFKTLERSYLMRINDKIIERPQHLLMRVSLSIHKDDIKEAIKSYKLMSDGYFTHATPTLFNMGTIIEQASSCFLLTIDDDSIDGIYKTLSDCAKISKYAGGIGLAIHKIRSKKSTIRGNIGVGTGIVPMLKVFNETARYVNQCFTPETLVYTPTGAKRMDKITTDDYLLTHNLKNNINTFKKVNSISCNYINNNIISIKMYNSFNFVNVTYEHNIYALKVNKHFKLNTIIQKLQNNELKPNFITSKDLYDLHNNNEFNIFIPMPIPTQNSYYTNYEILENGNKNNLDNDYCRFYGIMINNGNIKQNKYGKFELRIYLYSLIPTILTNINYNIDENENINDNSDENDDNIEHNESDDDNINENDDNIEHNESDDDNIDENNKKFELYIKHQYGIISPPITHKTSIETQEFLTKFFNRFNIKYKMTEVCKSDRGKLIEIYWEDEEENARDLYDAIYDENNNKKIDEEMLHLNNIKISNIIYGLMETGCYFTYQKQTKSIKYKTQSLNVAMSIKYMLIKMGILCNGYIQKFKKTIMINNNSTIIEDYDLYIIVLRISKPLIFLKNIIVNETLNRCHELNNYDSFKDYIRLINDLKYEDKYNFENENSYKKYFEYNNMLWCKTRNIYKTNYNGNVYDFNMVDNHNYTVVNLGLVHNSGKRSGSFAIYCEPWHADIEDFLKLRLNTGIEEERARDLFYALWVPDLFMKRVKDDLDWTLMCPKTCPDLYLKYGLEFEDLYTKYELEKRGKKTVKARYIWELLLQAQIETGMPYIGYKDAINEKNNQKNLGTIQSSNLCHEICEYTSKDEIAVCNLASVALPKFIEFDKDNNVFFNYEKLRDVVKQIVKNLNNIIDYNFYPVKEAENSNRKHRPIGIGCSGLADCFAMLKIAFDSNEAKIINKNIFENIYYAAVDSSMELSKKRKKYILEYKRLIKLGSNENGELTEEDKKRILELKENYFIIDEELNLPNQYAGSYSSFIGSPISYGKFQFDLWNIKPSDNMLELWTELKNNILKHGIRNSLLLALMPTASTSQILGWNECIEPFTNNIYTRKTLAGTFVIVNKYLITDLLELNLWNTNMKDKIIIADGSIQNIPEIPQNIKDRYKTVWEIKQRSIIDLAFDRAPFICQTQSMNLFIQNPTYKILNSMHFYTWEKGLKTGIYYLRSLAKTSAQKFSIDLEKTLINNTLPTESNNTTQSNNKDECIMCSS